jgi:hypothetical protein
LYWISVTFTTLIMAMSASFYRRRAHDDLQNTSSFG